MSAQIEFTVDGQTFTAPIIVGSEGERAIDLRKLRSETSLVAFDPALVNTATTASAITYLDGENGILRYRGYPVEQLAQHSTFLETAHLLIYGELPRIDELEQFVRSVTMHTLLHEDMRRFFDAFPKDAHPMAILAAGTSALSTFYQDSHDPFDPEDVEISIHRLIAKLPTVAAWAYKKSIGQAYVYPRNDLGFEANFLHTMFAVPAEELELDTDLVDALELLLILHADHEQNCSASTVRLVGSSHANLFSSVAAGISALWGPLHGGANQVVIEMLEAIRDSGGDATSFIARAKDEDDAFRLSGFGHRVYRNYDPRAALIKAMADRLIDRFAGLDELFEIAKQLEETALLDDYFIERKLYPNVDFYSGLIYRAMGLPLNMYPVLFALGRLPGWIAQWCEMMADPETRIGRPRQIYTGPTKREYRVADQQEVMGPSGVD